MNISGSDEADEAMEAAVAVKIGFIHERSRARSTLLTENKSPLSKAPAYKTANSVEKKEPELRMPLKELLLLFIGFL